MKSKALQRLVELGYGNFITNKRHDVFGGGLWSIDQFGISLVLFENGMIYSAMNVPSIEIQYSLITIIESTLTVEKISSRAGNFTGNEMLALRIYAGPCVELKIPLVIYSIIVRALNDLRKK